MYQMLKRVCFVRENVILTYFHCTSREYDQDDSLAITANEMRNFLNSVGDSEAVKSVDITMTVFDANGDAELDVEEFAQLIELSLTNSHLNNDELGEFINSGDIGGVRYIFKVRGQSLSNNSTTFKG